MKNISLVSKKKKKEFKDFFFFPPTMVVEPQNSASKKFRKSPSTSCEGFSKSAFGNSYSELFQKGISIQSSESDASAKIR